MGITIPRPPPMGGEVIMVFGIYTFCHIYIIILYYIILYMNHTVDVTALPNMHVMLAC